MNLWILKTGHKVRLSDGTLAKVLTETEDGNWIRVERLDLDEATLLGSGDLVNEREVEVLLGVAHPRAWEKNVTVMLHDVPESEDTEAYFEAVTMKGVPFGVCISGEDSDSPENALNRLLDGLRAFGFAGSVSVEDATQLGALNRYEISPENFSS